jgi:SAM-dependent methyltransferase
MARQYEALSAGAVHVWLEPLLPSVPALLLDVGAGTGRDAAWFASKGRQVVAIEPSVAMRR